MEYKYEQSYVFIESEFPNQGLHTISLVTCTSIKRVLMETRMFTTRTISIRTTMLLLAITCLALSIKNTKAAQYTVGESIGWGLGNNFEKWANQYTFYVGDELCKSFLSIVSTV